LYNQHGVVMPITLCLAGYFVAVWGLWRVRFSRPGCWRDLWLGMAATLVGSPIAAFGPGVFILRVT
jgi:NO-binding membrane sensor protein with MHYT domain